MRLAWRGCRLVAVAALSAGALSCVDPYQGSWVEFSLSKTTEIPGDPAAGTSRGSRPPSNTHYEYWVVTGGNAFHLADFLVSKQFDSTFPCFIETGRDKYLGLHSSKFYDKVLAEALAPPGDPTTPDQHEVDLLADADKRMQNQTAVENKLEAIVGWDPKITPQVLTDLSNEINATDGTGAPIDDISDEANKRRLAICNRFFAAHPDFYVGSDKVFSLPLTGHWYGMVENMDPRSGAPIGGAGFTVPATFKQFDYLWMTWQFNDPADPRITTAVGGGPYGPSAVGYHYMTGKPEYRTRRTINVELQNELFGTISGHMAIFPGINEDDATF
jgi:hypothetical protein